MVGTAGITECGIAPGSTFTYNWTVQNVGTLYVPFEYDHIGTNIDTVRLFSWWHAHHTTVGHW